MLGKSHIKDFDNISPKFKKPLPCTIGVVGNPFTDVSCGKFLFKFLKLLVPLSKNLFVFNDGFPRRSSNHKINVVKTQSMLITKIREKKSFLARCVCFTLSELAQTFGVLKKAKYIDILIVLPTTSILPIFFSVLIRKKVFVMAAQDFKWAYSKGTVESIAFGFFKILRELSLFFSDRIIVESRDVMLSLGIKKYEEKTVIAPVYVDTYNYVIKKRYKSRRNVIGYVGSLIKRKGVKEFVMAMPKIVKELPDVIFIIGGNGPLLSDLQNIVNTYGFKSKVKFIGYIPEKELPKFLNELKLFILPSYSEGLPNIVLEAMACGTPVLATPVGAIPSVIRDGENGFIMKNNSPKCIAQNVIRAINFKDLRRISENARCLVEAEYCYKAAIERYRRMLWN